MFVVSGLKQFRCAFTADDRTGRDVLMGYLVGVEVETKVSEAIDPRHYDTGFHSTATAGSIGAGAAAARLLGLDPAVTAVALGIAASQAGGLRENFGTMTKPFHAGRAADSGVFAASLARDGFTAASNILEAKRGFFSAAGGGTNWKARYCRSASRSRALSSPGRARHLRSEANRSSRPGPPGAGWSGAGWLGASWSGAGRSEPTASTKSASQLPSRSVAGSTGGGSGPLRASCSWDTNTGFELVLGCSRTLIGTLKERSCGIEASGAPVRPARLVLPVRSAAALRRIAGVA